MLSFDDFLAWEETTRDTIDFKKTYVDMTGDILAGLVLSEIIYWHMPSKKGRSRLSVHRDGQEWIACHRVEWWDRTRMTPRQIDRVFKILIAKGLIVKDRFHFAGKPTVHVRLNKERFLELWQGLVKNPPVNPYKSNSPNGEIEDCLFHQTVKTNSPNGENQFTASVNSYTETTTETTSRKRAVTHTTGKNTPEEAKAKTLIQAWADTCGLFGTFDNRTRMAQAKKMLAWDEPPTVEEVKQVVSDRLKIPRKGQYEFAYVAEDILERRQFVAMEAMKRQTEEQKRRQMSDKADLHSALMLGGGAVA